VHALRRKLRLMAPAKRSSALSCVAPWRTRYKRVVGGWVMGAPGK
jgi:hypothetical protein